MSFLRIRTFRQQRRQKEKENTGTAKLHFDCLCCDVEGTLEGEVTVLELLAMKASSTVQGDLYYGQLSVEAGAKALGTFRMGVAEDKSSKTASKEDAIASLKASRIPSENEQTQTQEKKVEA